MQNEGEGFRDSFGGWRGYKGVKPCGNFERVDLGERGWFDNKIPVLLNSSLIITLIKKKSDEIIRTTFLFFEHENLTRISKLKVITKEKKSPEKL